MQQGYRRNREEAKKRDKKRKGESVKLKNQAVLNKIIEKNLMRRSYKDRMEAMAKMRLRERQVREKQEKERKTAVDQKHLPVSIRG